MKRSVLPARGLIVLLAVGTFCAPVQALRLSKGGAWKRTTKVGPDAEVPGWYINLGITGARAMIRDDVQKVLEIMFVFKGTPAFGKLKVGDKVVGVNGRRFVTPHKFGYGVDKFGYEGPMMDFGNALEVSQGPKLRGKLTLNVLRGGRPVRVELKVPTKYGSYAKTYPYDCAKTDRILAELYPYIVRRQRDNGLWSGRPHINAFATLALMASGQRKYMPAVNKAVRAMAASTDARINFGGLSAWKYGMYGAVLGEYHLLTGEKWVLRELQEINEWLAKGQSPNGGWGHRPWNFDGEGNGYGAINVITMQGKMAWSLMQRCGIKVDPKRYAATHDFVVKGTNRIGYVWYKDGGARNPKYADMGRTGAAALAHYLSPTGGKVYRDYAMLAARCIGNNPKTFPDTHGSPILGMAWTGLGAAIDPPSFRKLMDHNRWSFTLAHCVDGTFYYQPNRDNNAQDYSAAPRLAASAATALIFSVKHRKLLMTGAKLSEAQVVAAKVQSVRTAEAARRYSQAWQECRLLGKIVYEGTTEHTFYRQTLARLQKTGAKLAGELAAKSPRPALGELRTFLTRWDGCDGLEPVHHAVNAAGDGELTELLAQSRGTNDALREFARQWARYPVAARASAALADRGETALKDLTRRGKKPSLTVLKAFVTRWAGTPAAAKADVMARELGNKLARTDLERILKDRPTAMVYAGFLKRWKGYPVADEAAAMFNDKAKGLLAKADVGTDAQRARNLRYFARSWAFLPVGGEALKRRNEIAAKLLREITALTDGKKMPRLRSFIRTYGDTPAAVAAKTELPGG